MTVSAADWNSRFASRLGVTAPSAQDIEALLAVAGAAAHASERTAAPVACWLAARAGILPDRALEIATSLADEIAESAKP